MGALLALIPTKDWLIGAAFAVLLMAGIHYHNKYAEAVDYAQTVKAESKQAQEDAAALISLLTNQYTAALKANKAVYENELHTADLQHASDTERLRSAATARQNDPVLSGAAGLAAAITAWSARLGRVEGLSAGLADALRYDDAAATAGPRRIDWQMNP
jgi:hypothetical protein